MWMGDLQMLPLTVCGKEGRTRREALVLSRGHWESSLFVIFFFFYLIEQ